jgi:peptidoglycan/xylan/chitin deacetylase (PgdA/CDA1 family)
MLLKSGIPYTNPPEIPVLCYHQIRNWQSTDSKFARTYIMPPEKFAAQMKLLADSGYHAVTPDELADYLINEISLPSKPILITFDDGTASQFMNAVPVLKQHHFNAAFFLMTVSLNKNFYMSTEQVKILSDDGFIIGCHTWDHHNVTGYANNDWVIQFEKPKQFLEKITGKPIEYFAYPNGIWNEEAIEQLKTYNYKEEFQLADKKS